MKKYWPILLVSGIFLVASGSGAILQLGLGLVPLLTTGLGLVLLLGAVLVTLGGRTGSGTD